ncbi:hypothetical protein [Phytohabitans kaempferiae]|uniref:Uncharacterized protein n=1 Tax=Phytohabitans kaempferiae TaxID=1620943 RepID=A0ABV6MDR8_9ACTN
MREPTESTDRHRPRHVDRRDQGLRRQRLVTQAAAGGATALALLFGWAFAQPAPAADPPAEQPSPAPAEQPPAAKKPAAGTAEKPGLKAPAEAPEEAPPAQEKAAPPPPPDTQSGGS